MSVGSVETTPAARRLGASARAAARLLAVQALYQMEIRGAAADETVLEFIQHRTEPPCVGDGDEDSVPLDADQVLFADLVRGVDRDHGDLVVALDGCLDGRNTMERLEPLLRAILGAGAYELRSRDDIPTRVVISEYVRLTDAFFEGKEPGLVNAVLDRLARVVRDDTAPALDASPDEASDNPVGGGTENGAAHR
ncbi:MAG: transcription antitermination factor NusB [Rhodospirillaceae bacterium]|nr:transcription antitermination factor NusB [Rhodospirillaceae bacterium]